VRFLGPVLAMALPMAVLVGLWVYWGAELLPVWMR
jgi:hypothetical protein